MVFKVSYNPNHSVILHTAGPVLESFQLKMGDNDIREREQEDLLPGIHFILGVDEKQAVVVTMGASPVCKTRPCHLKALTTTSMIHIPCLFFLYVLSILLSLAL